MGLALFLIGVLIWLTISPFWGIILMIIGLILIFVPGVPYGYGWYSGRRNRLP